MMRAVIIEKHGGPEVLRLVEVPRPALQPGEALIRVRACGLNRGLDARTRENGAGRSIRFPHILGTEVVGEVAESRGGTFRPGDAVMVVPWQTCGVCANCRARRENACASKLNLGIDIPGGYAEFLAVDERSLIALPSLERAYEAAALPISFTTAWHMLKTRAGVGADDTVLILGAAGSIGLASLQLSKHLGATAFAAASSPDKLAVAKEYGADELIEYSSEDFAEEVRRLTKGRGVDVVVDHIGSATWAGSIASMAPNGRLVMCGATTGHTLQVDARLLWRRNISLLFSNSGTTNDLREIVQMWRQGSIRPLVANVFPLAEVAAAHAMLENRHTIGKVVLSL